MSSFTLFALKRDHRAASEALIGVYMNANRFSPETIERLENEERVLKEKLDLAIKVAEECQE